MSRRNAKKLQKFAQGRAENEEEEDEEPARGSVFADFAQSSSSSDDEEVGPTSYSAAPLPPTLSEERKATDDIGQILEEFGVPDDSPPAAEPARQKESVLKRRAKHFNHLAELAKRFKTSAPVRGHMMQKRVLLTPAIPQQWPRVIDYSLTMTKMSEQPVLFCFEPTKGYSKIQAEYSSCVESFDPSAISLFLQLHPFHIEALFQMCTFYHLQSNFEQMEQLLLRLLYVFQISFHQEFSVLRLDAQLDFSSTVYNRLFYQCLTLQIEILGRKGCSRTALEFSKVLLALRPTLDPMGAIFLVEYYSLRAKKWDFFLRFVEEFMQEAHGRGHLVCFPNILFSVALVRALQSPAREAISPAHVQNVLSLPTVSAVFSCDASTTLLAGICLYPSVANSLMHKISKTHEDIETDGDSPLGSVTHVGEIYAERCSDLWKADVIANWLREACGLAEEVAPAQLRLFNSMEVVASLDRYAKLDKSHFSDTVRTVIPRELFMPR